MALWKKATSLKDGTLQESHSLFEFTSWSQDVEKWEIWTMNTVNPPSKIKIRKVKHSSFKKSCMKSHYNHLK